VPLNKASLPCPKCNALITKVTSSLRTASGDFYRYRQCEFCGHRYKTVQLAEILAEPGEVRTIHEGHAAIINWKKVFDRVLPSLLQKHDKA
jgi:transcriptional regulator NrdR family protein